MGGQHIYVQAVLERWSLTSQVLIHWDQDIFEFLNSLAPGRFKFNFR